MQKQLKQAGFGIAELAVIAIIVVAIVIGGWYVWHAQNAKNQAQGSNTQSASSLQAQGQPGAKAPASSPTTTSDQAPKQNVFKLPELGVEFDVKDGLTPLYNVADYNYKGVNYKLIRMSTEQLVDKGGSACKFSPAAAPSNPGFSLLVINAYNSRTDLLAVEKDSHPNLSVADIKPERGYYEIGGKVFAVPLPGTVQSGAGLCTQDGALDAQQRQALEQVLVTLRASK